MKGGTYMPYQYNKLRGKIIEHYGTQPSGFRTSASMASTGISAVGTDGAGLFIICIGSEAL